MLFPVDALSDAMMSGAIVLVAIVGAMIGLKHPWLATAATLVSLAVVPFWFGLTVSVFFISVHLALMMLSIVSILLNSKTPVRLTIADSALAAVFALTLVCYVLRFVGLTQVYSFFQWMVAYWFARLAATAFGIRRLATVLAVTMPFVAIFMIIETLTGVNVWQTYLALDNSQFDQWSGQQLRGDVVRAEGPFGHSIAAGSVLAVALVLTFGAKLSSWVRLLIVLIISCGIAVTISRLSLVTAALGTILALLLARTPLRRGEKWGIAALLGLVAVVAQPIVGNIFTESGDEATNSAAYRTWILDLSAWLRPLGYSTAADRSTSGGTSFGDFGSIDSAALFYALTNGWIPTLILLGLLVAAAIQLARRRGGVSTAALVAQIPAMFAVALITSYAHMFWICAGFAMTEIAATELRQRSKNLPTPSPQLSATR